MRKLSSEKVIAVVILILLIFNLSHAVNSYVRMSVHAEKAEYVILSIGYLGLTLSSECTSTRNPILELLCACLGDIPGAYCYHLSCALVGVPILENATDQIEVRGMMIGMARSL